MKPTKIVVNGEVVELRSDGIPVQPFSKEQYEKLTEDEKQKSMLCLVDEPTWYPTTLSVQEYDTEVDGCQWHVRKWSDGYVEMGGKRTISNVGITNNINGVYTANIGCCYFPIELIEKYSESASLSYTKDALWLGYGDDSIYNELKRTPQYVLYRFLALNNAGPLSLSINVSGCWK